MKSVSAPELSAWLADEGREAPVLLDVREPWETQICRIDGSELVLMRALPARLHGLESLRPDRLHLPSRRSQCPCAIFLARQGFEDVYNLTGGVDAWARQVDAAMPIY